MVTPRVRNKIVKIRLATICLGSLTTLLYSCYDRRIIPAFFPFSCFLLFLYKLNEHDHTYTIDVSPEAAKLIRLFDYHDNGIVRFDDLTRLEKNSSGCLRTVKNCPTRAWLATGSWSNSVHSSSLAHSALRYSLFALFFFCKIGRSLFLQRSRDFFNQINLTGLRDPNRLSWIPQRITISEIVADADCKMVEPQQKKM